MRYRVKNYSAAIGVSTVFFNIPVSKDVYDSLTTDNTTQHLNAASLRKVIESVRLIADETRGGFVIMSTGQKNVIEWANKATSGSSYTVSINIQKSVLVEIADGDEDDLAAIAAMSGNDMFTIEMDWGESPSDLGGGGGIEIATQTEFAAFKSHLQDEIDNILTPIDDESESASE